MAHVVYITRPSVYLSPAARPHPSPSCTFVRTRSPGAQCPARLTFATQIHPQPAKEYTGGLCTLPLPEAIIHFSIVHGALAPPAQRAARSRHALPRCEPATGCTRAPRAAARSLRCAGGARSARLEAVVPEELLRVDGAAGAEVLLVDLGGARRVVERAARLRQEVEADRAEAALVEPLHRVRRERKEAAHLPPTARDAERGSGGGARKRWYAQQAKTFGVCWSRGERVVSSRGTRVVGVAAHAYARGDGRALEEAEHGIAVALLAVRGRNHEAAKLRHHRRVPARHRWG
eukprot:1686711-Prymnesium_polylepis.1